MNDEPLKETLCRVSGSLAEVTVERDALRARVEKLREGIRKAMRTCSRQDRGHVDCWQDGRQALAADDAAGMKPADEPWEGDPPECKWCGRSMCGINEAGACPECAR